MRRAMTTIAVATALAASLMVTGVGAAGATELAPSAQSGATADRNGGGGPTPNAQLPDAIQVKDPNLRIVSVMRGIGKQVYDCQAGGTYKGREPVATLTSLRGAPTGIHGAGPFWASFDGSRVVGVSPVVDTAPSPSGPTNVAWLKVTAKEVFGQGGVFSKVAFIQRTDTRGGQPPAKCTVPSTIAVDYSTYYVFWASK
jgi:hypothetical protein